MHPERARPVRTCSGGWRAGYVAAGADSWLGPLPELGRNLPEPIQSRDDSSSRKPNEVGDCSLIAAIDVIQPSGHAHVRWRLAKKATHEVTIGKQVLQGTGRPLWQF